MMGGFTPGQDADEVTFTDAGTGGIYLFLIQI